MQKIVVGKDVIRVKRVVIVGEKFLITVNSLDDDGDYQMVMTRKELASLVNMLEIALFLNPNQ